MTHSKRIKTPCSKCGGKGWVLIAENRGQICDECKGKGYHERTVVIAPRG